MKKPSVLLLLLLLLVGCGTETTATPVPVLESPLVQDSPLAVPTKPVATESVRTPVPPPPGDKGAVVGRFVDYETGEPVQSAMPIYLGVLSAMSPGDSHVVTLLPSSAPHTEVDEQGYFAFAEVEPEAYALVFWTPMSSFVVTDPETKQDIVVDVQAGEINDLGELVIIPPSQ